MYKCIVIDNIPKFNEENSNQQNRFIKLCERVGRSTISGVEEVGNGGVLIGECFYWLIYGPRVKQSVRLGAIFQQMMEIGIML